MPWLLGTVDRVGRIVVDVPAVRIQNRNRSIRTQVVSIVQSLPMLGLFVGLHYNLNNGY